MVALAVHARSLGWRNALATGKSLPGAGASKLACALVFCCALFWLPAAFAKDADTDGDAGTKESTVVWVGMDNVSGVYGDFDAGFITALNGDLSKNGFLFRGDSLHVSIADGGLGQDWDVMAGYQYHFNWVAISAFAGADFQKQPQPSCDDLPYGAAFKVAASIETDREAPFSGSWDGVYSMALDTYWSRARAGYNVRSVRIGPEAVFQGNRSFREEKAGGFVEIPLEGVLSYPANIEFSGGYQWSQDWCKLNCQNLTGGVQRVSGTYLSAGLGFSF
jgi:Cellulose biosynthesis protein BcsS